MTLAAADDTASLAPVDLALDRIDRAAGTRIGRYILNRRIGRGALSIVYEAYDPDLGRAVALKLVAGADGIRGVLLAREARALAAIAHPNVVIVHDVGTTDDGTMFIAMELVCGQTLTNWQRSGPSPHERRRVLADVGRGLLAAHHADLLHRDIKPDNIMVADDGRVVVLDFGLVAAAQTTQRTQALGLAADDPAERVGTPTYMAPEQFADGITTATSDQFSFCAVAWELLLDERPFGSGPIEEVQARRKAGTFVSARGRGLDRRLQRVLTRGLSADPSRRWPSLAPIIAALERKPLLRPSVLAGVAAFAIVGAVLHASMAPHEHCRDPDANADEAWDDGARTRLHAHAEPLARAADDYAQRLRRAWSAACEATGRGTIAAYAELDTCLTSRRRGLQEVVDAALSDRAPSDAIANAIARLPDPQRCLGSPANRPPPPAPEQRDAIAELQRRLEHAERLSIIGRHEASDEEFAALAPEIEAQAYLPQLAHLRVRMAVDAWERHRPGATAALESAYAIAVAARAQEHAVLAATMLAQQYASFEHEYRAGLVWLQVARAHLAGADLGAAAEIRLDDVESSVLLRRGDVEGALAASRTAVARAERELDDDDSLLATLHANLATTYMAARRYAEARPQFERARAELETRFGANGLTVGHQLMNEAMNLGALGDVDGAITLLEHSLDIFEINVGPDSPLSVLPRSQLAWMLLNGGEVEAALRLAEGTGELARGRFGSENGTTAVIECRVGWIRAAAGDLVGAHAALDDCDATEIASGGPENPQRWLAALLRGHLARVEGRPLDAVAELERAARWIANEPHAEREEAAAVEFELGRALIASAADPTRGRGLVERSTVELDDDSCSWRFLLVGGAIDSTREHHHGG